MAFANRIKFIAETEYMWDGVKDDKGRFLLQRLGETGRQYNLNIWANKVKWEIETECNPDDIFIIDDWRYVNEAEVFENDDRYNVIKINIVRENNENSLPEHLASDVSEHGLDNYADFNYIVYNNSDLEGFKCQAEDVYLMLQWIADERLCSKRELSAQLRLRFL